MESATGKLCRSWTRIKRGSGYRLIECKLPVDIQYRIPGTWNGGRVASAGEHQDRDFDDRGSCLCGGWSSSVWERDAHREGGAMEELRISLCDWGHANRRGGQEVCRRGMVRGME